MNRVATSIGLALFSTLTAVGCLGQNAVGASQAIKSNQGLHPDLVGQIARPLRYKPAGADFVIENGPEFFNRSLYGGNTAFRVEGGDKPEFVLYLPGRGGNLRLGIQVEEKSKWLKDTQSIETRYRPGELVYLIRDPTLGPAGHLQVETLAYANTEGLIVRVEGKSLPSGTKLLWVYGGVNGERGARDADIGTEPVPLSQYFQFQPSFAEGNAFSLDAEGFTLRSSHATIAGVTPEGATQHVAGAQQWNNLAAFLADTGAAATPQVIVGSAPLSDQHPLLLSLQRIDGAADAPADLSTYREVTNSSVRAKHAEAAPLPPRYPRASLPHQFALAEQHFAALRERVRIETPDPYLDAAMGALNIVSDALWDCDAKAIMHGSIAWRTKLLGWRGPYVLDDLGWHDRARQNFDTWLPQQNTDPIGPVPPRDPKANLARNEPGLHSNGDLSHSHYDMNMVFMDALFRHLLWTGDKVFARSAWPVIKRHLAWEKRLFRREYGPDKLPLYEAYATIWASDDLYYSGGGTAYASAYNIYANRMAARIAGMVGEDPAPYSDEANQIEKAIHSLLWLPNQGTFAESKDWVGDQRLHPDYGLWNFYHTVDEEAVTPREAWQMGADLESHLRHIPIEGEGVPKDRRYYVLAETDWMPYSWSINNVVMDENLHTALALWQGGRPESAYLITKGALLASMFMGIAPGNVGTMNYLDAYRRESQRDFGDAAGTMSRNIVEGLFGIHPDAIAGTLTITPGFPEDWHHARIVHPDVSMGFLRTGRVDTWAITQTERRFKTTTLHIPARYGRVQKVEVDGVAVPWRSDRQAVGRPMLEIVIPARGSDRIQITWAGAPLHSDEQASTRSSGSREGWTKKTAGVFSWWVPDTKPPQSAARTTPGFDWRSASSSAHIETVDLNPWFNDSVSAIFAPGKYVAPRYPGVSLAIPSQGVGAWAGHLNELPAIDDSGLRQVAAEHGGKLMMPNGVPFLTPTNKGSKNVVFTSVWKNYPRSVTVPLEGKAKHIYLLMAGSTNFMQSRMDNGQVEVTYSDGTSALLPLRNPETWWPIEQDYFIDDYQFPFEGPLPPRVNLSSGEIRILDLRDFKGKGQEVPGGAATVLDLALDPDKRLRSFTVRTLANDVVIGLMSATLERP